MTAESFISWDFEEEEGYYLISHLWVAPSERRQGVARRLLREALAEMAAEGRSGTVKLCADSEAEDPEDPIEAADLVEFYEDEGFTVEEAHTVIIMSAAL